MIFIFISSNKVKVLNLLSSIKQEINIGFLFVVKEFIILFVFS